MMGKYVPLCVSLGARQCWDQIKEQIGFEDVGCNTVPLGLTAVFQNLRSEKCICFVFSFWDNYMILFVLSVVLCSFWEAVVACDIRRFCN